VFLYININNIFLSIKNLILIRALANNKKKNSKISEIEIQSQYFKVVFVFVIQLCF